MDHNTETNTIRSSKASISCIEVINFYFFSKTFKCDVALFLSPGVISGYWFRLHTQLESASAYLIKADWLTHCCERSATEQRCYFGVNIFVASLHFPS